MTTRALHPSGLSVITGALAICASTLSIPAAAESGADIAIGGEVAPRCWVANPAIMLTNAPTMSVARRAICNQSVPRLVAEVRGLGPDGKVLRRTSYKVSRAQALPISSRAALEIVVSPQI